MMRTPYSPFVDTCNHMVISFSSDGSPPPINGGIAASRAGEPSSDSNAAAEHTHERGHCSQQGGGKGPPWLYYDFAPSDPDLC